MAPTFAEDITLSPVDGIVSRGQDASEHMAWGFVRLEYEKKLMLSPPNLEAIPVYWMSAWRHGNRAMAGGHARRAAPER
jgi:hypothetical protein